LKSSTVGEVAKLMTEVGLIVITAFISPFCFEFEMVRNMMIPGDFIEVFIDTPLCIAEERDVIGFYAKARSGKLKILLVSIALMRQQKMPEIRIDTTQMTMDNAAEKIIKRLI